MKKRLTDQDLFDRFRDAAVIKGLQKEIHHLARDLPHDLKIMEVCGGHTHTIMRYGLDQLMPANIELIHGPGCPVCVMPKERIDHAWALASLDNVILVTLGDMIRVPGSCGSLQDARAQGADVRFVYSPLDTIKIARENSGRLVVFFAIGFETTTPMTAALLQQIINAGITNILLHINHITVPEPMRVLLDSPDCRIDAFLGPAHVSVMTGAEIFTEFAHRHHTPVVISGFEPVDVMQSVLMLLRQFHQKRRAVEIQYSRSVTPQGNRTAQALVSRFFEKRENFRWRGIGDIPRSAWRIRQEFARHDAEKVFGNQLPQAPIDDHQACRCGQILRGAAKPFECGVFGKACTPKTPLGSCMVSSEGACNAYYRYKT